MFVELGIHEDFEPDYELKFIFMKRFFLFSALAVCLALAGCNERQEHSLSSVAQMPVSADTVVSVVEVPRKEKLLAAKKAGIHMVLVPEKNEPDVRELDAEITDGLQIEFVGSMEQVLKLALVEKK